MGLVTSYGTDVGFSNVRVTRYLEESFGGQSLCRFKRESRREIRDIT